MRIALLIHYDGSDYHGWQFQPDQKTIQGTLEEALQKIFEQASGLTGSGRTDSGVHALGQVAHFDVKQTTIPDGNIWMALNRHLPKDIRVVASQKVADDFHSRFMATKREYQYQISLSENILQRNSQWHVRFPLEFKKLQAASAHILGRHDFSSFCFAGTETENMHCHIIKAEWTETAPATLNFQIKADRYLHHMVRMLVGSMVEVARGKWELERFINLLEQPNRQAHAVTAPAEGLALIKVSYPDHAQANWLISQQDVASLGDLG